MCQALPNCIPIANESPHLRTPMAKQLSLLKTAAPYPAPQRPEKAEDRNRETRGSCARWTSQDTMLFRHVGDSLWFYRGSEVFDSAPHARDTMPSDPNPNRVCGSEDCTPMLPSPMPAARRPGLLSYRCTWCSKTQNAG